MATYWIIQVDQPSGKPITKVCACVYSIPTTAKPGGSLSTAESRTRQQVVNDITLGTHSYFTSRAVTGGYLVGAEVVLTKDKAHITTVGNNTTVDNLGSLPACSC